MLNFLKLILAIAICQVAGLIGSIFTFSSVSNWYQTLNKPIFNPPNWIFGHVWTFLFFLMGVSLYLIIKNNIFEKKILIALIFFGLQLALNILWSYLFFTLKCPLCSLMEILILWLAILATITIFYKINHLASYLLIPYLLWVSFATILNFYIFKLN